MLLVLVNFFQCVNIQVYLKMAGAVAFQIDGFWISVAPFEVSALLYFEFQKLIVGNHLMSNNIHFV